MHLMIELKKISETELEWYGLPTTIDPSNVYKGNITKTTNTFEEFVQKLEQFDISVGKEIQSNFKGSKIGIILYLSTHYHGQLTPVTRFSSC